MKLKSGRYRLLPDGTVKFMKPADKTAKTVKVPAAVTIDGRRMKVSEIAPKAFYRNRALTKVTIGKTVKMIGKSAFLGCVNLETVKGGRGVTSIGACAFKNCSALKSVTLYKKVTAIGKSAFLGCKNLKTVKGGKGVASIGAYAFKNCTALTSITLNRNVKSVGKGAFQSCAKLKKITIRTTNLATGNVGRSAFKGISPNAAFKCPKAKLKAYKKLLPKKGAPKKAKYR